MFRPLIGLIPLKSISVDQSQRVKSVFLEAQEALQGLSNNFKRSLACTSVFSFFVGLGFTAQIMIPDEQDLLRVQEVNTSFNSHQKSTAGQTGEML